MRKTNLQDIAEQLAEAKLDISALESDYKAKVKPFEAEVEVLEGELLAELRGLPPGYRIATMVGVSFSREVSTTFEVSDNAQALKWGLREGVMRIDMVKARSKLIKTPVTPQGFTKVETPKLSVKGLRKKKDEAD